MIPNKVKPVIIGLPVLGLCIIVFFAFCQVSNNSDKKVYETETDLCESVWEAEETIESPAAENVVYEVTNGQRPSIYCAKEYTQKDALVHNPDGTVTWESIRYRRDASVKADLFLGIDNYGAADAIFLVAHNTAKNTVTVLMIPRDSMLDIDFVNEQGELVQNFEHISLSYINGDTKQKKALATSKAVSDLLCGLQINHYMVIDLQNIVEINDLIGGVPVTIPSDDYTKANPAWKMGEEIILMGDDAERFIRYRDIDVPGSPISRMEQHKEYINAFYHKVYKNSELICKLIDYVEKNVITDMSKGECEKFFVDIAPHYSDLYNDICILPGFSETGDEENGQAFDQYYINYQETIPILLNCFYRKVDL